jgi:hypothetical protein
VYIHPDNDLDSSISHSPIHFSLNSIVYGITLHKLLQEQLNKALLLLLLLPLLLPLLLSRSQWSRGLRRGFAAARLLGLRVRIPPELWMSASCGCGVLSSRGLCVVLITRPEESYQVWCVWVWSWRLVNEGALPHWGLLINETELLSLLRLLLVWQCSLSNLFLIKVKILSTRRFSLFPSSEKSRCQGTCLVLRGIHFTSVV